MARQNRKLKKKARKLYPHIEFYRQPIEGNTPDERFDNAASKIYRAWDKRDKKD